MDTLLTAGTDGALVALYDPTALPGDDPHEAAEAGLMLLWATAADGHVRVRLLADEPVPDELRARARHGRAGLLLRLPTGRLAATDAAELDGEAHAQATLPPGDYLAEGFELTPAGHARLRQVFTDDRPREAVVVLTKLPDAAPRPAGGAFGAGA